MLLSYITSISSTRITIQQKLSQSPGCALAVQYVPLPCSLLLSFDVLRLLQQGSHGVSKSSCNRRRHRSWQRSPLDLVCGSSFRTISPPIAGKSSVRASIILAANLRNTRRRQKSWERGSCVRINHRQPPKRTDILQEGSTDEKFRT